MVSVAAEKIGGMFFHLTGNTSEKATEGFLPQSAGKTAPSLGMSLDIDIDSVEKLLMTTMKGVQPTQWWGLRGDFSRGFVLAGLCHH